MNQVILVGRSGANAEIRYTAGGHPVVNLSVATSEKNKEGGYDTSWHRVVLFGRIAEAFGPRITKGCELMVMGKITYNDWTDKSGNRRMNVNIVAHMIKIIESAPRQQQREEQPHTSTLDTSGLPDLNEDIPF